MKYELSKTNKSIIGISIFLKSIFTTHFLKQTFHSPSKNFHHIPFCFNNGGTRAAWTTQVCIKSDVDVPQHDLRWSKEHHELQWKQEHLSVCTRSHTINLTNILIWSLRNSAECFPLILCHNVFKMFKLSNFLSSLKTFGPHYFFLSLFLNKIQRIGW